MDGPLTIALVSTQARWHGGEQQAALLARGLRRQGHRCVVLARHGSAFAERLAEDGFAVYPFRGLGRGPVSLWRMRRQLAALRPDVLHFNDPHALTSAGLAAWGLGIPLRVAARRVDFRVNSPGRYRRFADVMLCVSQAVYEVCHQDGIPDTMLQVVHDGVDPRRVASGNRARGRQQLALTPDQLLLLTVAKLTDHKGHCYLLDAMPQVLARHPQTVLALAGEGELRQELERRTAELGIANHVRFLGYRSDVPDLLAAADLTVVPSHMEGLCSSIIDAMLVGCPVVASRAGGIPDLLQVDADAPPVGWLVEPRNPAALASALISALASPADRQARAQVARARALACFTDATMVARTLDVYRQFLGRERQRRAA